MTRRRPQVRALPNPPGRVVYWLARNPFKVRDSDRNRARLPTTRRMRTALSGAGRPRSRLVPATPNPRHREVMAACRPLKAEARVRISVVLPWVVAPRWSGRLLSVEGRVRFLSAQPGTVV